MKDNLLHLRDRPAIGPKDITDFEDRLTARQLLILSTIEHDAYQEGYDKGYDQGMEDGYTEARFGEQFPATLTRPR